MHLVVEDGGALSRLVVEDVVGEGHAGVVVVDGADAELADVLVQGKLVEAHRAHERDVRRLQVAEGEEVQCGLSACGLGYVVISPVSG